MVKAPKVIRSFLDRTRSATLMSGLSLTRQAHRDECNINSIMKKYERTGLVEHVNRFGGSYGDFVGVQDYQASVNQVMEAHEAFMTLPAAVRKRFDNDPGQFLDFVMDASNLDEMRALGLANPPPADNDADVPPASPEASQAS